MDKPYEYLRHIREYESLDGETYRISYAGYIGADMVGIMVRTVCLYTNSILKEVWWKHD